MSLLPLFLLAFNTPPFRVSYNLLTILRGCFTPKGLIHLLLFYPYPFSPLSFLSLLFSFFPPFSSFSLSLFLQIFGAATAAMPHRFRRAWQQQQQKQNTTKQNKTKSNNTTQNKIKTKQKQRLRRGGWAFWHIIWHGMPIYCDSP